MKPITLHPGSLFAGAGIAALAFVAAGMASPRDARGLSQEDDLRDAVEQFLSDPVGDDAQEAMSTVVSLTDERDDVEVVIAPEVLVWYSDEEEYAGSDQLLVSFIAGNVRSQLDTGVSRNDDYSGLIQVIRVYRALVEADPDMEHEALEELIEKQGEGEMIRWLANRDGEEEGE
jgi:hypothetical protein